MKQAHTNTPYWARYEMAQELRKLFKGHTYCAPGGKDSRKPLTVYEQDLPPSTMNDEDVDTPKAFAPFLIVEVTGGAIEEPKKPQTVEMTITICTYSEEGANEGIGEAMNIKEDIVQHFCTQNVFGEAFSVLFPMGWAVQTDRTPPYYFAALSLIITAPAMNYESNNVIGAMI